MYPIYEVSPGSEGLVDEQIGSRPKYWLDYPGLGRCLFKYSRPGTGEHWAEVIASRIAGELDPPHARYFLAKSAEQWRVLSMSMVPADQSLVHANELLAEQSPEYDPMARNYSSNQHTIEAIFQLLTNRIGLPYPHRVDPPAVVAAADWFIGYLLLDALIGNTDRHDQNWGAMRSEIWRPALFLAPTFDHASSLGCHIKDTECQQRLATRDRGYSAQAYADRCRSAIFPTKKHKIPMHPYDAFAQFALLRPLAGDYWLDRLRAVSEFELDSYVDRLPPESCSQPSREFAKAILRHNRTRLLQ